MTRPISFCTPPHDSVGSQLYAQMGGERSSWWVFPQQPAAAGKRTSSLVRHTGNRLWKHIPHIKRTVLLTSASPYSGGGADTQIIGTATVALPSHVGSHNADLHASLYSMLIAPPPIYRLPCVGSRPEFSDVGR